MLVFCFDLVGFVQNYVHVLIESQNFALKTHFIVIVQPDLDSRFCLEESEDHGEWIDTLGLAFFGHVNYKRMIRALKIINSTN